MAQANRNPNSDRAFAPFADATRRGVSSVSGNTGSAQPVPSPAKALQAVLEASVEAQPVGFVQAYSPRTVTASVVTLCLAFWMAIYLAASAAL